MEAFLTSAKFHRYKTRNRLYELPLSLINQSEEDVPLFLATNDTTDILRLSSENTTESIIKFAESVVSVAVCPEGIFVATESGDIQRISDSTLKDIFRCSRKTTQPDAAAADHDIFSSLLDDEFLTKFEEPVKTFYYGAENVVLKHPGVQVIHAAGGYLIVVCLGEGVWSVLAYKQSDFDAGMKKFVDVPRVLSLNIDAGDGCDLVTQPIVCVVKPFDENQNVISDCLNLNKILYNKLFGYDENLLDISVIILGLPNGHVYSIPINGTSDLSMLYQCRESVVGIHGVELEESDTRTRDLLELSFGQKGTCLDSGATTLVLTCTDGNICLIHGSSSSNEPVYLNKYLQGSLISTAASGSSLILSTWSDLYHVEMKLKNDDGGQFILETEKTRLGFGHMTDVLFDDAKSSIYTINNKGKIFKISLANSQAALTGQPGQAVYGEQMKELLSKITTISEKLLEESKTSATLDKVLSQLNLATSIQLENSVEKLTFVNCAQHQTTRRTINWSFKVLKVSEGIYCSYSLQVNLENCSNILLESGWKFTVSLVPVRDFHCAKRCETESFILPKLQPSHKHLINIPMNSKTVSDLPLTVRTSLLWSPNVPKNDSKTIGRFLRTVCVSLVPTDLSILDFCSGRKTDESSVLSHVEPSLPEQLMTLSESRPHETVFGFGKMAPGSIAVMQGPKVRSVSKMSASSSQSGWSSSFLVDDGGRCKKCFQKEDVSPEACLLNQLLQLDSNTLPNVAIVRLVTPKGDSISIAVEATKGGRLKVVLQGPTMNVVQEIQHALRSRLIRDSSSSSLNSGGYNRRRMNQVLQEYEVLRKELQSLTVELRKNVTPSQELLEKVVGIHQRLRDVNIETI